jgi:hypothetical protein
MVRRERHELGGGYFAVPELFGHPDEYDIVWNDPKTLGSHDNPGQGCLVMLEPGVALYTKIEPIKPSIIEALWTKLRGSSRKQIPRYHVYLKNLKTRREVKVVDFPVGRKGFYLLFFVPGHHGAYVRAGEKHYRLTIDPAMIDSIR